MKIQKFDTANLKLVRERLQAALNEAGREFGIVAELKNIKYEENRFSVTLDCMLGEDLADAKDQNAAEEFKRWARVFGLKPETVGKTAVIRGVAYKVVGARAGRSEKSILIERTSDAKRFAVSPSDLRAARFEDGFVADAAVAV